MILIIKHVNDVNNKNINEINIFYEKFIVYSLNGKKMITLLILQNGDYLILIDIIILAIKALKIDTIIVYWVIIITSA